MKQLSGLDELFLALERPNQCMHVAVLGIYDPVTAPGGRVRLRDILAHVRQRLDVAPVFRRKLVTVPFDLDRAYWVDEARVDLEYHIRHIALPKPGDWRQLMIQVARLHSQALDRAKPLWQAYVIEGIDNVDGVAPGSFAVYIKFHHAAVDGDSSAQILRALHSLIAVPEHFTLKPTVVEAPPSAIELYTRAWGNLVPRAARLWHATSTVALKVASLATEALYKRTTSGRAWSDSMRDQLAWPEGAARSRFAGPVSSRRIVEGVSFDLGQVHRIRKWTGGATINEVFLTIVGGALRRYLHACTEPVGPDLAASVAGPRDILPGGDPGNSLHHSRLRLHPNIASGLDRLDAIRADAAGRRQSADVMPTRLTTSLVHHWVGDYVNILASSVRGPDVRLYLAGARLSRYYPIGAVKDGVGLNIAGFTYCDALWATVVSCRKMIPEPELFSRCLRESFEALCAEVDAREAAQASMAEPRRRAPPRPAAVMPGKRSRKRAGHSPVAPIAVLPEPTGRLQ